MSASESQVNVSSGGCELSRRGIEMFHVSSVKGNSNDLIGGVKIQPQPPDISAQLTNRNSKQVFNIECVSQ